MSTGRARGRVRAGRALAQRLVLWLSLVILGLLGPTEARAADHGDPVILIDEGSAAVLLVQPHATVQDVLWSGAPLVAPTDAILAADGALLIADPGADVIHRFDWVAGIEPEPFMPLGGVDLCWLTRSPPANLVYVSGAAGLFEVDASSGSMTRVPASLATPFDVVAMPGGDLLVADPGLVGVMRVNPTNGATAPFAYGGFNCWIALGDQGELYAAGPGGVYLAPPGTGQLEPFATGGFLVDPSALAIGHDGHVYVAERAAPGIGPAIVRLDPGSGAQTVIASGGSLDSPSAVIVLPVAAVPGLAPVGDWLLAAAFAVLVISVWRQLRRAPASPPRTRPGA